MGRPARALGRGAQSAGRARLRGGARPGHDHNDRPADNPSGPGGRVGPVCPATRAVNEDKSND